MELLQAGRAREAVDVAMRLAEDYPGDAAVAQVLGLSLAASGRLADARDRLQAAARSHPRHPGIHQALARVLCASGRHRDALPLLQQLCDGPAAPVELRADLVRAAIASGELALARCEAEALTRDRPGSAVTWSLLGRALEAEGAYTESAGAFEQAAALDPTDPSHLANLAAVHLRAGQADAASSAAQRALALAPGHRNAARTAALADRARGRLDDASARLAVLLEGSPEDVELLCDLADCEQMRGSWDAAREAFQRCLQVDAGESRALAGLASLDELEGRYESGWERLRPIMDSESPAVLTVLARLSRRRGRTDQVRQRIESVLDGAGGGALLGAAGERQLLFALGDLLADEGEHERAFQAYRRANALRRSRFDPRAHHERTMQIARCFPGTSETAPRRSEHDIVLIVGMPRSGTSLLEQILAAHPQVHAAGESPALARAVRSVAPETDADAWRRPDPEALRSAVDSYLAGLGADGLGAGIITDKMPLNFLYLGAVDSMIPTARVIHCRRDIADVALSCFATDFSDPALGFTCDVEDLAAFVGDYLDLMTHWRSNLSLPILEIDYEGLVTDLEATVRRTLEFLGLPWEPACLEPHRVSRQVETASYAQVREPVYTRSIGRSGPYRGHLGPVLEVVAARDRRPG